MQIQHIQGKHNQLPMEVGLALHLLLVRMEMEIIQQLLLQILETHTHAR